QEVEQEKEGWQVIWRGCWFHPLTLGGCNDDLSWSWVVAEICHGDAVCRRVVRRFGSRRRGWRASGRQTSVSTTTIDAEENHRRAAGRYRNCTSGVGAARRPGSHGSTLADQCTRRSCRQRRCAKADGAGDQESRCCSG